MRMDGEGRALLRLGLTPGLGAQGIRSIVARFGSAGRAVAATTGEIAELLGRHRLAALVLAGPDPAVVEEAAARLAACDGWILGHHEVGFPSSLQEIPQPPALLFGRGEASLLGLPGVAIVGSRRSTEEGRMIARTLAGGVARRGVVVISGLARGIDAEAHRGALGVGGATVAVLGSGIDVPYPAENRRLHEEIATRGCLLSEYPPGIEARPGHFPERNRLIAGLARAVVVVEARERSGALITARYALDQGTDVLAVPGSPLRPTSAGANRLIQEGAGLVLGPEDILCALGIAPQTKGEEDRGLGSSPLLDAAERALWEHLSPEPVHVDALARRAGLPMRDALAHLLAMELKDLVHQHPGLRFARSSRV